MSDVPNTKEYRKVIGFSGFGKSLGLTIPKHILEYLDIKNGDYIKVELDKENNRIILEKA